MESFDAFKEKLDNEYAWPATYMFKFVVPSATLIEVTSLFPKDSLETKPSKNGNYLALTMKRLVHSSDEVVEVYKSVSGIKGLIAL